MSDSTWFDDEEDRAARGDGGLAQQQQAGYDATGYDPGWQQQPQQQSYAAAAPYASGYDPSGYFDPSQLPVPDDPSYLTQPVQPRVIASSSSAAAHPSSWAAPAAPMLSAADLVAEAEQFEQPQQHLQQQQYPAYSMQAASEFEQAQAEEGAWSATGAAAGGSSSFAAAASVLPWRESARGGGRAGSRGGRGSARGGRGGRGGGAGYSSSSSSSSGGGGGSYGGACSSGGYSFGLTPAAAASSSAGFGSSSRGSSASRGGRGGRGGGRGGGSGLPGSRNNSSGFTGSAAFPLNNVYSNQASEPGYSTRFGSEQDRIKDEEFMGPDLDFGVEEDSGFVPLGRGGASSSSAAPTAAAAASSSVPGRPRTDARGHTIVASSTLSIDQLPERFRCVFPYPRFNRVQTTCFHAAFNTDKNVIVSAPTGSGKTVIFELALLRFFKDELLNPEYARKLGGIAAAQPLTGPELAAAAAAGGADDDMTNAQVAASAAPAAPAKMSRIGDKKAVYLAPLKALCDERFQDWVHRLTLTLGLQIVQMTSDNPVSPWKLKRANIVITTGEKWDVISRRQEDADVKLVKSVGLLLVDEVHMLNQVGRGAVLEGLMSRMIVRSQEAQSEVENPLWRRPIAGLRILGLSATAPNAADVAEWLHADVFSFQNNLRPVPIEYKCYPYFSSGNSFVFENSLNNRLLELIRQHGAGRPTLIFVSTRKATYLAAQCILDQVQKLGLLTDLVSDQGQQARLVAALNNLSDPHSQMANLLRCGLGVHHGGLSPTERHTIEALFTNGDLKVVCATSTLGQGVNLPAHMVIIRGTSHWNGKENVELDSSTIMQMIGRAGRPQYDKEGVALVMTSQDKFDRYNKILEGQPIESRLFASMIEHLASEIVASGAASIQHLMHWVKSTFMFTRMLKNPVAYFGHWANSERIELEMEEKLKELVKQLVDNRLVELLPEQGLFRGTGLAVLMSRWYLCFKTVCLFNNIAEDSTFQDFLEIFAKAEEWAEQEFKIKAGDKGVLNPLLVLRRRKKAAQPTQAQMLEQELAAVAPKFDEEGRPLDSSMPPPPAQPSVVDLEPDQLPFPPQGRRITTMADKLSVLVQVRCCGLTDKLSNHFNLRSEMMSLTGPGARVAKAMCDYMIQRAEFDMATRGEGLASNDPPGHVRTGWIALKNAIQFSKCVENSAFDKCPQIFAQLPRVGEVTARRLYSNCKTFEDLMLSDPHVIADLSGHQLKWVQELLDMIHRDIPLYQVTIAQLGYTPATKCARVLVKFNLFMVRDDAPKLRRPDQHLAHVIVGSLKKELFYYRRITASQLPFEATIDVPLGTQLKAYIIDDKIVGADSHNIAYLRYGNNINSQLDPNEFFRCLTQVSREFDKLELQKRKETPEEEAAAIAAAAQAPEGDGSDAAAGGASSSSDSRPQSKSSGFCKHKAGKCQAGQCKHVCCHTRAQALGDLGAKWPNPLFTQDADADADMSGAGGSSSVFAAAPVSRKLSGAAARSDAFREMIEDELVISQAQLGSKRLRLGSSGMSSGNAGAYYESEAARSVARDNTLMQRQTQHIAQQHEWEQSRQFYSQSQSQPHPSPFGYGPSSLPAAAAATSDPAIPQVEWPAVDPSATPQFGGGGDGVASNAYLHSLFTPVRHPESSQPNQWAGLFDEEDPDKAAPLTPAQIALKKRKCPIGH